MKGSSASPRRVVIVALSIALVAFLVALAFLGLMIPEWETERIFPGWTDSVHDMALDSDGNPCIAGLSVIDGALSLTFAKRVSGYWEIVPLEPVTREYFDISIALDSQNKVHICAGSPMSGYSGASRLTYCTDKNGSWTVQDISIDHIFLSSKIAVDSQGQAHILYTEFEKISYPQTWNTLHVSDASAMLLSETDGGWTKSVVFDSGKNTSTYVSSFAIGSDDRMHALIQNYLYTAGMYSDFGHTYLNYTSAVSGDWIQETVQQSPGEVMASASMALDGQSRAHICGYLWDDASSTYSMAYSNNLSGAWAISRAGYAGNIWPSSCSLAIDSQGATHIAYYAQFYNQTTSPKYNQTERYLTNKDGPWTSKILDDKGGWDTADRIRVRVGPDDRVQISYFCNLGKEGTGDRYYVLFTTPTNAATEFGNAILTASLYALATVPFVVVGAFIYWRRTKRRAWTAESEDGEKGKVERAPPSD